MHVKQRLSTRFSEVSRLPLAATEAQVAKALDGLEQDCVLQPMGPTWAGESRLHVFKTVRRNARACRGRAAAVRAFETSAERWLRSKKRKAGMLRSI